MESGTAPGNLTAQQRVAIDRRESSVVLSSGAGCGKTFVLTRRFLSHLEKDEADISQIVAITFTDRAARVMRGRIRRAVLDHLKNASTANEVERWEGHLRALETAQISTIHAFCATLLRQHAFLLGIDPTFDVLEDFLAKNLEREALRECLQGLLSAHTPVGDDLRELVLLFGWRPTVTAVQHLMTDQDRAAWKDRLALSPAQIAADWQRLARAEFLPRYLAYLGQASSRMVRCLRLLRTTTCSGPIMQANVELILENFPRLTEADDLGEAIDQLREAAKVGPEKGKAWPSEEVYRHIQNALKGFREDLPDKLGIFCIEPENLVAAAAAGQRFLRVAAAAAHAYQQAKRRRGVVDFDDLVREARDLLRDNQEVRERLQKRYRFLLVDELQDTDPVQMELVRRLAGEELKTRKVFAVGDHAQSIYRFRRADVRQFQELKHDMPAAGRLGLTENFRSQPAILHFVNALFGPTTTGIDACLEDYKKLEPFHPQMHAGPCIEFLWSPRAEKERVTPARQKEADWIARRLVALIGGGEALVRDKTTKALRPVRPGDVTLLFRAMSNVQIYEEALRRYKLDYYLVGGRAFFAQQEVYDLLNLLRALENPQDAVSLAGTLRSPFCCLSDEALFVLSRVRGGLWAGLHDDATCQGLPGDQAARAERARRWLDDWRRLKDRRPIAVLLGEIFAACGYDAALRFEFLGDRKLANLWKLQDMARAFDRSGLFGLAEFINHLGDLVRTQPREEQAATQPESADVLRLMTIHQAKGLEFPVVVVPDVAAAGGGEHWPVAHWDPNLGCVTRPVDDPPVFSSFGWDLWRASEQMENWREDLRTLYVACTRAEDYLILSAALKEPFTPEGAWMQTLAERFDWHSGECLDGGLEDKNKPKIRVTNHLQPPLAADNLPPLPRQEQPVHPKDESCLPIGTIHAAPRRKSPDKASESRRSWDAEDGSDRWTWSS